MFAAARLAVVRGERLEMRVHAPSVAFDGRVPTYGTTPVAAEAARSRNNTAQSQQSHRREEGGKEADMVSGGQECESTCFFS